MTLTIFACALLLAGSAVSSEPPPTGESPARKGRFDETVAVERVLMEIRAVRSGGAVVRDLTLDELRVTVERAPVELESLKWIAPETANSAAADGKAAVAAGRSVVFLFQKNLHASSNAGLLRMARRAKDVIRDLPAADRVAVSSFGTSLRLWQDLTTDHVRATRAIDDGVIMGREARAVGVEAVLRPLLDRRRGDSMEQSLRLLAEALETVPGDRSLVLVASQMGRSPSMAIAAEHEEAQRALARARVVVYSLDLTDADHHTLELGLQVVAADNGGFYARTHEFSGQAVTRLQGALEGYYLLSFVKPPARPGFHHVHIRSTRDGVTILARGGYAE